MWCAPTLGLYSSYSKFLFTTSSAGGTTTYAKATSKTQPFFNIFTKSFGTKTKMLLRQTVPMCLDES